MHALTQPSHLRPPARCCRRLRLAATGGSSSSRRKGSSSTTTTTSSRSRRRGSSASSSSASSSSTSSSSASSSSASHHLARRAALLGLLASCAPWPAQAAAAAAALPQGRKRLRQAADTASFYAAWPYAQPADILPFLRDRAAPGDVAALLQAFDTFSEFYPQYAVGAVKGVLLEGVLRDTTPQLVLELGGFLGYSALRIARQLQLQAGGGSSGSGGRLLSVEANPANAAVAREVLAYAGLAQRVTVIDGLSSQVIPTLPALLAGSAQQAQGQGPVAGFDLVFLDHAKSCYLPDLQHLEQLGLVRRGTTLVADNVLWPGAPGYLEFLEASGRFTTRLLPAPHEVDQPWRDDWEPKPDALAVSLCTAGADGAAALL